MSTYTLDLGAWKEPETPKERKELFRNLIVSFDSKKTDVPVTSAPHPFCDALSEVISRYGDTAYMPKLVAYLKSANPELLSASLRYNPNVAGRLTLDERGQLVLCTATRERVLMKYGPSGPQIVGFYDPS